MLFTQALQGIGYFENVKYADMQKIASAVRMMRVMIGLGEERTQIRENLGKGIFKEKNQALLQVYQAEKKTTEIASIRMCYGMANEVETILQEIYETKALDKCTVALADYNAYSQIFYDYSVSHAIPVTFGRGVSITNTIPAMLLRKYEHWSSDGFFDAASLSSIEEGRWHIVDYKTNYEGEHLDKKYRAQLDAYIKALKQTTGHDADAKIYHIDL